MGAIHNKLRERFASQTFRTDLQNQSRLCGSAILLSVMLLTPAASVADPTPEQNTPAALFGPAPAEPNHPANPVSMSPNLVGGRPNTMSALTPLEGDQTSRPLTRAAAQLRVETMSPADWLASFGNVTVGRINPNGQE